MKLAEMRKLETEKLIRQAGEVRLEIADLRRSIAQGETTNVRNVRNKRKQLARMLTVVGEKLSKEKV